jgi:hypothetical protein
MTNVWIFVAVANLAALLIVMGIMYFSSRLTHRVQLTVVERREPKLDRAHDEDEGVRR